MHCKGGFFGFSGGKTGTFNSGQDGDWSGLIFVGDQGRIYGQSFALGADISIPADKTLTIESGKTLTIAEGKTLTNNGTISYNGTVENYGSIDNKGGLIGDGIIKTAITLHANGGAYSAGFEAPSFYTYSKEETTVPLPVAEGSSSGELVPSISRGGHTFEGWYEASDFSGARVYNVPSYCLTAKDYYAKWTLIADGITTDTGSLDFGTAEYGYSDFKPITVTIKRNGATGDVKLWQPVDSTMFLVIGDLEYASSDPDVIATFTIRPNTGLALGSYSATILVDGTAASSDDSVKEVKTYVPVSFTVEKASPKLTITPSSSTVLRGEDIELTVSSNVALPEDAALSLEHKQDVGLGAAEKVPLERISGNCFRAQVPALFYGTYRFRVDLAESKDGNYSAAYAECEVSVSLGITIDPPASDPPANETTIVVGNNEKVGVAVSGGQAAVKKISSELLETITAVEGSGLQSSLVLDLSKTGSTVTSTKISKESVENIAGAANSSEGGLESLTVKMTNGAVELNKKALSSVASQASGRDLVIALKEQKKAELNVLQQLALGYERALYGCFSATITSGSSEIHEFGSGAATLSFPFEPAPNTDPKNFRLVHVSEEGKLEYCPTTLKGNVLSGTTTHLSTYAIVYIEPAEQTLALAEELGALPAAGELKAANAKAAVAQARGLLAQVAALADDQRAVVDEALVANAEQVVERGTELIEEAEKTAAKADAKAVSKVRNKAFSVKAGKSKSIAFKTKVSAAGTRVTYKKVRGSKYITVTKAGKVTAKKGLKKGWEYTVRVKVTCGDATKTVKVTVRVR